MNQTTDFFKQAETTIMETLLRVKPELLASYGNVAEEIKSDNSPVTALDKKLEEQLRDVLTRLDPTIPIIGEEYGGSTSGSTFWLIDPIDNTESFIRGLPFVRNQVTLIDNHEPVFAFIYKPVTDELYIAVKDKGATKNGERIHASSRPINRVWLEASAVSLSAAHCANMLINLSEKINGFRQLGDFTFAAEGKVDGLLTYKPGGGPWDYAPRGLLMQESGAKVTNIGSDTYDYRNFDMLAANPVIFDEIMTIINQSLRKD